MDIAMNEFIEKRLDIKKRILVVVGDQNEQKVFRMILGLKFDVLCVSDGKSAIDAILSAPDSYSLIMLDMDLPDNSAYDLLGMVHNDLNLSHIPVVALTSDVSEETKVLEIGAADFLQKPYGSPTIILARAEKTMNAWEDGRLVAATQFDDLTKLFTREYFYEYVKFLDKKDPNIAMDAVVIDINNFHVINEMHGRALGDEMLRRIGERIGDYVKEYKGIACRYDADTFYLYLPFSDNAEKLFKRVMYGIDDLIDEANTRIRVGVYSNVDKKLDIQRRFECASIACNKIKGVFAAKIAYYDMEMHERRTYDERLMADMDKALNEKQFVVYYQPKFNIQGKKPVLSSAEALVRWVHPELGMVQPNRFILLFEQNGMIRKIDRYVWKEAARQLAQWKEKFGVSVPVSVNVSRIDMMDHGFVDDITKIVSDAGLETSEYYLEVTESAYTEDAEQIIEVVKKLREKGFHVEMDDFGTGYSSLNMLSSMPIDILKLDITFVRRIHLNEKDLRMVVLIINIAKALDITVVAEGVEFEEQYELLKKYGCNAAQGFLFSRPVIPDEFEKFINEDKGRMK